MAEKVKFGIFWKLLVFSLAISLIPLAFIVYLAFTGMTGMGSLLLREGKDGLENLGAQIIENKAKDVRRQMEIYVRSHPQMTIKDLQNDAEFQAIAVQPVGQTGYTAAQDTVTAVNYFHKNPKIVNMDLHQLAAKLPEFWKIMEGSLGGPDSSGYYDWTDADGVTRQKYMFITNLEAKTRDGVQMGVAATTYLDEFSKPMIQLEETVSSLIREKLLVFYFLIALTFVVVLVSCYFLARTITRPVLYLARVADEISTGKLGTKIEISSRDEIGVLIRSIRRMQRSLALAIKKLRAKRLAAAAR